MARVTVELGATIPTQDYGNLRPVVRISDIDLDGDVDKQLSEAMTVAVRVYKALDDQLELLVNDTISGEAKPSARETIAKLTTWAKQVSEVLRAKGILPPKAEVTTVPETPVEPPKRGGKKT